MAQDQDRRRFHRFPFDAEGSLELEGGARTGCELLDLSINGVLLKVSDPSQIDPEAAEHLRLILRGTQQDDSVELSMAVEAVRSIDDCLACRFVAVDVDSFSRLKQLITDNLGDISLLDRELTRLDYWPGVPLERVAH